MPDNTMTGIDAETTRRVNEVLAESGLLDNLFPREPRYRYFQRANGPMFCWTVERVNGKYVSMVYRPIGKGARSGKATEWELVESGKWKRVAHAKRKDAKARALRLHRANA